MVVGWPPRWVTQKWTIAAFVVQPFASLSRRVDINLCPQRPLPLLNATRFTAYPPFSSEISDFAKLHA